MPLFYTLHCNRTTPVQVRREMESQVPVTPPESALWLACLMRETWTPFFAPLFMKENLSQWQASQHTSQR